MAFTEDSNIQLQHQLREAWRQVAELRWQLQAEQRNSKRLERLLDSKDVVLADVREQHDQALSDRDQQIADLEDEHDTAATAWEAERGAARVLAHSLPASSRVPPDAATRDGCGVGILRQLISSCGERVTHAEVRAELADWDRRCGVVLEVDAELAGCSTAQSVIAALRRVFASHMDVSDAQFQPDIEAHLAPSILDRRQVILCSLLLHTWLCVATKTVRGNFRSGVNIRTGVSRDARLETRVHIGVVGATDLVETDRGEQARATAMLESIVTCLQGEMKLAPRDVGVTVTFPAASQV